MPSIVNAFCTNKIIGKDKKEISKSPKLLVGFINLNGIDF